MKNVIIKHVTARRRTGQFLTMSKAEPKTLVTCQLLELTRCQVGGIVTKVLGSGFMINEKGKESKAKLRPQYQSDLDRPMK